MIVLPNASTPCFPGNAYPRARLADQLVPVTKPGLFLDDNLALLPRHAAQVFLPASEHPAQAPASYPDHLALLLQAYFSIADQLERCVPTRPLNKLCQKRWEWPECRVHQALATVPGLLIGELPSTTPAFAFVDCEGRNKNGPPCLKPYRRWQYRHFSERVGFSSAKSRRAGFLGSELLGASQFAPVALRKLCHSTQVDPDIGSRIDR